MTRPNASRSRANPSATMVARRIRPADPSAFSQREVFNTPTAVRKPSSSGPSGYAGAPSNSISPVARARVPSLSLSRRIRNPPPERGTRKHPIPGVGCFLVPRSGGGFRIRRLKDKLGTRALATGEIEFEGAPAYPLGPLEDGFRTAVGVLNTSRWLNALGSAGLMRRATIVAEGFAREREAFGRAISDYPLVRENLAVMKAEADAALASTMELTELVDRIDKGEAGEEDTAWHRLLVNANKFVTSLAATKVIRRGIEALGGNGTIEDFSPLPRLYRDAIVFESWEGTHNVLCAQVLRDLARLDAVDLVVERSGASAELAARLRRSVDDPAVGALHGRRQLDALVRSLQVKALRSREPHAAELLRRRHLTPRWDPEDDPDYPDLIDRVLADA